MAWAFIFLVCIVGANAAVVLFGMVPVLPGLFAPAGVFFAGLGFTARDFFQEYLAKAYPGQGVFGPMLFLIGFGAVLSAVISPQLALASGAAFFISEFADFFVYTPLRAKRWLLAVTLSNTVGLVVDSILFLYLAFGSLDYLKGQVVGKLMMTVLAVILILLWRRLTAPLLPSR